MRPPAVVRGTDDGAIRVFKGIPYARPPVGGLRWRPPVPLPRWTGERAATDFGPACVQPQSKTRNGLVYWQPPMPVSEDCLTLNVWTPANAKRAPVLVWIHGGALVTGIEPRADVRRAAAGRARRDRRVDQLPARRARLARAPGAEQRDRRSGCRAITGCSIRSRRCAGCATTSRAFGGDRGATSRSRASPRAGSARST